MSNTSKTSLKMLITNVPCIDHSPKLIFLDGYNNNRQLYDKTELSVIVSFLLKCFQQLNHLRIIMPESVNALPFIKLFNAFHFFIHSCVVHCWL